ncbi:hypothetical protein FOCG_18102 [Fusarium oxysporum f. sp. radicis-lycopersici 26381]|nr:hypothetical protein FOCG_18102 [Fusarium oxysporum f. sp. radicis-lycopersici 26381]
MKLKVNPLFSTILSLCPVIAAARGQTLGKHGGGGDGDASPGHAGKTLNYQLNLTWADGEPDGFTRKLIFINGQFPGPTIHADQGDQVQVLVYNNLPFNTSIHFHGIEQLGTLYSDGVPGVTQKTIHPGGSFLYNWTATQYGAYWYHSHYRGQIEDGLYGAITISPNRSVQKPFYVISNDSATIVQLEKAERAVKPLIFGDWTHMTSTETIALILDSGLEANCLDSILVNGKGSVRCLSNEVLKANTPPQIASVLQGKGLTPKGCLPASLFAARAPPNTADLSKIPSSVFDICTPTTGATEAVSVCPRTGQEWIAFDFVSAASSLSLTVSVDQHPMWVYAVDGLYVVPMLVEAITMENGERYSVLLHLDQTPGNYSIRAASAIPQVITTSAVLQYACPGVQSNPGPSDPYITVSGANSTKDVNFFNTVEQRTFQAPPISQQVNATYILHTGSMNRGCLWSLNHTCYDASLEDTSQIPLLGGPASAVDFPGLVMNSTFGSWTDIILLSTDLGAPHHPIHKHSNKAYIIGQGTGPFNFTTVAEAASAMPEAFNLVNPPLRDSFVIPAVGFEPTWLAIRFQSVNPGPSFIHCHIASHLGGGMAMIFMDGTDRWPSVPDQFINYNGGLWDASTIVASSSTSRAASATQPSSGDDTKSSGVAGRSIIRGWWYLACLIFVPYRLL